MEKLNLRTKKASEWAIEEIGISAEQLYYLLKTITEGKASFEDDQSSNLLEIAWNLSGDINAWLHAEEQRQNG